jgi:HPt (histidine-containing phosphotransfer) domain-containing protein
MSAPTIDLATFRDLQETAGADFVTELVDTFLEEAPGMLQDLRAALAAGNADKFRRGAHSLKSNSNTFGALTLGSMARELELGGLPSSQDEGGPKVQAVADEFVRVKTALAELRHA